MWSDVKMTGLPSTEASLLVRTDFNDDAAWEETKAATLAENGEGFRAYLQVVDDATLREAIWQDLRRAALALEHRAAVLFIADRAALAGDHPIQVVDLSSDSRPPFRCVARELWGVDNNVNMANMDWEDFADNVEADGIYRGFS
jgi:hypothetical protein